MSEDEIKKRLQELTSELTIRKEQRKLEPIEERIEKMTKELHEFGKRIYTDFMISIVVIGILFFMLLVLLHFQKL